VFRTQDRLWYCVRLVPPDAGTGRFEQCHPRAHFCGPLSYAQTLFRIRPIDVFIGPAATQAGRTGAPRTFRFDGQGWRDVQAWATAHHIVPLAAVRSPRGRAACGPLLLHATAHYFCALLCPRCILLNTPTCSIVNTRGCASFQNNLEVGRAAAKISISIGSEDGKSWLRRRRSSVYLM
jgi:hypothetical protein